MLTTTHYRALSTNLLWIGGIIIALNFVINFVIGLLWDLASFLPFPPSGPGTPLVLLTQFITSVFPAWLGGLCLVAAIILMRVIPLREQGEGGAPMR